VEGFIRYFEIFIYGNQVSLRMNMDENRNSPTTIEKSLPYKTLTISVKPFMAFCEPGFTTVQYARIRELAC
jgi:hypothetical protein